MSCPRFKMAWTERRWRFYPSWMPLGMTVATWEKQTTEEHAVEVWQNLVDDGCAIVLLYREGTLIKGVTRG